MRKAVQDSKDISWINIYIQWSFLADYIHMKCWFSMPVPVCLNVGCGCQNQSLKFVFHGNGEGADSGGGRYNREEYYRTLCVFPYE